MFIFTIHFFYLRDVNTNSYYGYSTKLKNDLQSCFYFPLSWMFQFQNLKPFCCLKNKYNRLKHRSRVSFIKNIDVK